MSMGQVRFGTYFVFPYLYPGATPQSKANSLAAAIDLNNILNEQLINSVLVQTEHEDPPYFYVKTDTTVSDKKAFLKKEAKAIQKAKDHFLDNPDVYSALKKMVLRYRYQIKNLPKHRTNLPSQELAVFYTPFG